MIYNFRFDRDSREEVLHRLREYRLLCQGWGGGEQGELRIDQDDYVEACRQHYALASTRIPTNLSRMKRFLDGDILVTPHLPENGQVSIHIVDGDFPICYSYLDSDDFHLNNQIRVKASYGLDGNISIYNRLLAPWYGKLQWLRLPVLPIEELEGIFRQIITELDSSPATTYSLSKTDEYLESLTLELLDVLRGNLGKISPSSSDISFEKVCEYLISESGYTIEGRNIYDKAGGDVDLKCIRERSNLSPFESGQVTLFVQVKKHAGTTDAHAVRQLVQMMRDEPGADGCVMSLADDFTTEAKQLAKREGILLLNGESLTRLCLQGLGRRLTIG
jgi:hypothetical protein